MPTLNLDDTIQKQQEMQSPKLSFAYKQMNDLNLKILIDKIKHDTYFEGLYLVGNLITDESVPDLIELLKENKTLRELNIEDNKLSEQGLIQLLKGLIGNEQLEILKIGYNKHENQLSLTDGFLQALVKHHQEYGLKLKVLWMPGNQFTNAAQKSLVDLLKNNFSLLSLSLRHHQMTDYSELLNSICSLTCSLAKFDWATFANIESEQKLSVDRFLEHNAGLQNIPEVASEKIFLEKKVEETGYSLKNDSLEEPPSQGRKKTSTFKDVKDFLKKFSVGKQQGKQIIIQRNDDDEGRNAVTVNRERSATTPVIQDPSFFKPSVNGIGTSFQTSTNGSQMRHIK